MFRSSQISRDNFMEYITSISNSFCPFLAPSTEQKTLFFSEYCVEESSLTTFHETVFYLCFIHTELLRHLRSVERDKARALLLCENLVFYPDGDFDGKKILAMPHWILKCGYTSKGLLFGKFWKGEKDNSKQGVPIPEPPCDFISIRSAVKPTDKRFFEKAVILKDVYLASNDDDLPAYDHLWFGLTKPVIIETVEKLEWVDISPEKIWLLVDKLKRTTFFERAKKWSLELKPE